MLVVAPHGGTSTEDLLTSASAGRRGNDLHTGDLAHDLARALGASVVVNDVVDRNELDLNRVSDVVRRAPWFLRELERQLDRILSLHPTALVLFVHGWHVEQARCDLGVGASLEHVAEAGGKADVLTVRPESLTGPVEAFRRELERAGVLTTYGDRWPAAHRNNMMRLFRTRPDERDLSPRIAGWVGDGRVDAVQLELGAPLRWPGPQRRQLVACAARTLGGNAAGAAADGAAEPSVAETESFDRPTSRMLQVFDASCGEDGLGVVVGAMHLPGRDVGARLQLFPGGQRMGIFVGHGRVEGALGVPDLYFHETPDGFDVAFDGRVLEAADAAAYFQNEATRVHAKLRPAVVRLSFRESAGGVGRVEGEVALEGRTYRVEAPGFADARSLPGRGGRPGTQLVAAFDDAPALRVHGPAEEGAWRVSRLEGREWSDVEHTGRLRSGAEELRIELDGASAVTAQVRTQAALLRPIGPRQYVHTTFGLARVRLGEGQDGVGFFEQRRSL